MSVRKLAEADGAPAAASLILETSGECTFGIFVFILYDCRYDFAALCSFYDFLFLAVLICKPLLIWEG